MVYYPGDTVRIVAVKADDYDELKVLSQYLDKTAKIVAVYDEGAIISIGNAIITSVWDYDCFELLEREYISRRFKVNEKPKKVNKETEKEPEKPVPVERPSKDEYYMEIAKAVSLRSTCLRRCYGAVIVKDEEIISTGYNGAPRGEQNCSDTGECYRQRMGIPHGEQYEKCVAVHAEQNAIISAKRSEMIGATLYLYGYDVEEDKEIKAIPCDICSRLIKNAGIERVVSKEELNANRTHRS